MRDIFIIGVGGFLGAIARYLVSIFIGQRWGAGFPMGTFVVNITGCLLIGFLMPLLTERFLLSPQWRIFLVIGFLGAYTTFSTFAYETNALIEDREWLFAGLNASLSVFLGLSALKIGETLSKLI